MRYKEIAERLQISPRTVEVQVGKALKLLRATLGDLLPMALILLILEGFEKL
ncbi:MAG: sigma factor-like helix-turn-helix DNA-binding protein [Bacteroidota bacterium]